MIAEFVAGNFVPILENREKLNDAAQGAWHHDHSASLSEVH
jgi:hypothetical protein